ncbi:hypothetical protein ACHAXR_005213, partial [Thalassiosira sp. AJA248-18]
MSDQKKSKEKKSGRVVYDNPLVDPLTSLHWKRLESDLPENNDGDMIHTHEELIHAFQSDVNSFKSNDTKENHYLKLAVWSCVIGYCEALATHKDARYSLFPVPLRSLRRLVDQDFLPLLNEASAAMNNSKNARTQQGESSHRKTVRAVANAIWKRAQNRSSSIQDELHANSLYSCLRGDVDNKSLDCFGAALLVVIGMNILGFSNSCLTLSEDHAYESHILEDGDNDENNDQSSSSKKRATCEVAIPGNTKAAQSKRGKDISFTFEQLKRDNISAATSWLYMANNPVLCDSPDYMTRFPFALIELGECEEHLCSEKGLEWVDVSELMNSNGALVLRNEKLFLEAIHVSRSVYGDAQVYPYLYAGHYHKDAGRDDQSQEYRLVESLRLYAEAARVASGYRYDTKDCMQLMKHMTTVASLISKDILLLPQKNGGNGKESSSSGISRTWQRRDNAIAAATWLIGFFDSLLLWEEQEQSTFVEVLSIQHKDFVSKLFQLFSVDIRAEVIAKIHIEEMSDGASAITEHQLIFFRQPRSKRLAKGSLLVAALSRGKVVVRELEMALPSS